MLSIPDLKFSSSHLSKAITTQKPDHHILNVCYHLCKDTPSRQVILVSKDVNLRMNAKSVNLKAQDYTIDHVKDVSVLYEGLCNTPESL